MEFRFPDISNLHGKVGIWMEPSCDTAVMIGVVKPTHSAPGSCAAARATTTIAITRIGRLRSALGMENAVQRLGLPNVIEFSFLSSESRVAKLKRLVAM